MTGPRRQELATNLAQVEERIAAACASSGRERDDVHLVVVTKHFPRSDLDLLADLGVTDIGEN
ncbi:YggS family pyridoxal phosphate-dependent enzyme, partial [Janibacter sp. RAF20_2_2]